MTAWFDYSDIYYACENCGKWMYDWEHDNIPVESLS